MRERLILALRPWAHSDGSELWLGVLALLLVGVIAQARGRARIAHGLMAVSGVVLTGKLVVDLGWHYARCPVCSAGFDLAPNAASWSLLYDYLCCCVTLAFFAFQECRRFGVPYGRRVVWVCGMLVAPTVVAPLFFLARHEGETEGQPRVVPSWTGVYLALFVVSAPFVMPALPADHFGDFGGEFLLDGTSNRLNAYVASAVFLLFGQIFLFTLPRTKGLWLRVAGLFLAINCVASFLALWAAFYDRRFTVAGQGRHRFVPRGVVGISGAVVLASTVALVFSAGVRFTHFVMKDPNVVCEEGLATRAHALRACVRDLEESRALPDETRTCLDLARSSVSALRAGDERHVRQLTRELGRHHGSALPSCQEAASANYAVMNECREL